MRARFRSKKLWWLEIFLPLFLGALMWVSLSMVIYGGSVRDRLASLAEKFFIEEALRSSRYAATNRDAVTIVSLTEKDWESHPQARFGEYRDASLDVYAQVLERILKEQPKRIFLSWFPGAHDANDERVLSRLVEVVRSKRQDVTLYLVYPVGEIDSLPSSLLDAVTVLEGDDCHYAVMSHCSFWREWSDRWVIQVLADEFWVKSPQGVPADHLSTNLPHTLPNYLVHLPDVHSIDALSFSDVLGGHEEGKLRGRNVFVGSALVQQVTPPYDPATLWRTFTVHDRQELGLAQGGTPYHVFWAQLAQMFVDRTTVRVVSFTQEIGLLLIFCGLLLLLLWRFPAPVALCYYVGGAIALLVANQLLVSRLQVYAPVFDIIYAGFFTFLYPAFGMMSYELYKRWQSSAQGQALHQSDALKTNFVSLISHNLNTPVARMQGLVDILSAKPEASRARETLTGLRREIARLQLCVRAALIGSGLEDGARHEKTVSLNKMVEEFRDGVLPLMERLGTSVDVERTATEEDLLFLPVRLDLRLLMFSLAGLLALCETRTLRLVCSLSEGKDDAYRLTLRLDGRLDLLRRHWTADELSLGFFERTLVRFFRQFLELYEGHMHWEEASVLIEWPVRT